MAVISQIDAQGNAFVAVSEDEACNDVFMDQSYRRFRKVKLADRKRVPAYFRDSRLLIDGEVVKPVIFEVEPIL